MPSQSATGGAHHKGITKREYFAGLAMRASLAEFLDREIISARSVGIADALPRRTGAHVMTLPLKMNIKDSVRSATAAARPLHPSCGVLRPRDRAVAGELYRAGSDQLSNIIRQANPVPRRRLFRSDPTSRGTLFWILPSRGLSPFIAFLPVFPCSRSAIAQALPAAG